MRHIVVYDPHADSWAVVDIRAARMVVSYHSDADQARKAAEEIEQRWPDPFAAAAE